MNRTPTAFLFALLIAALLVRTLHFQKIVNFSSDQGSFGLHAYKLWTNKEISLVGPRTSFEYDGRVIFQGSIVYYLMLLFFGTRQF